jgi:hypothetical protein
MHVSFRHYAIERSADLEIAFDLDDGFQRRLCGHLLYGLRTDFAFDSLRSDPRYTELERKIGLPQL